jgi:hypothetical protein
MHKYRVRFEGHSAKKEHFVDVTELDAENEKEARIKAEIISKDSSPEGLLYKYGKGSEPITCLIEVTQLD